MRSVEMQMSGRTARSLRSFCLYSSTVWPRFMAARMRSEPLCTGRCRKLLSFGTLAYASIRLSLKSSGCEVVKRMRSTPVDRGDEVNQRRQIRERAVLHRTRVGVDVLAEQRHFAHALRRQACSDFLEHLLEGAADFLAARVGHDAEAAVLAAAFHDRDERGRARRARLRQAVEFLDFRKTDVDLRTAGFASGPASIVRQAVQGLRAEHQVDERRPRGDALALLARHAAAHPDDHMRPLPA